MAYFGGYRKKIIKTDFESSFFNFGSGVVFFPATASSFFLFSPIVAFRFNRIWPRKRIAWPQYHMKVSIHLRTEIKSDEEVRPGKSIRGSGKTHPFEELLGTDPGPGVDAELHLGDLFVDLLHEVDDEVDQLVAVHLLRVKVGDQEADVVALEVKKKRPHPRTGPTKT